MTRRKIMWSVAVVCIVVSLPSFTLAQTVCGDADQGGNVSLLDVFTILDYVLLGADVEPPLPWFADCDNRYGVTMADAGAITRYLFVTGEPSELDCVINDTYDFSPSLSDTVFLPYMTAIPDGLDVVELPVMTSLASDTKAFYIPCRGYETNGPGRFQLTGIDQLIETEDIIINGTTKPLDTAVLIAHEKYYRRDHLSGRRTIFALVFTRSQPGLAEVRCLDVVRSSVLRIAVEKGGDLYTPVIQYYEVPIPHPVVTATPSPLNMTAEGGYWSKTSYDVTFTSDDAIVSFDLGVSDEWIVIENPSPTGYTTPATITVKSNASALTPGDYQGQITISNANPDDAEFVPSAIDIALAVTEPLVIPPGDLNCDGMVSLGDVMLLIDCLFINTRPVPSCE